MKVPLELLTSLMKIYHKILDINIASIKLAHSTHLSILFPHLCMLPTQHLRVKKPISFTWNRLRIRLSPNLDALVQMNVFWYERVVEREQAQCRDGVRRGGR